MRVSYVRPWTVIALGALLAGCGSPPRPLSPDEQLRVEILALAPTDVQGAYDRASRIVDPVERGLAIELWIRQNRGKVDLTLATQLCHLTGVQREDVCVRHLSALHLVRD